MQLQDQLKLNPHKEANQAKVKETDEREDFLLQIRNKVSTCHDTPFQDPTILERCINMFGATSCFTLIVYRFCCYLKLHAHADSNIVLWNHLKFIFKHVSKYFSFGLAMMQICGGKADNPFPEAQTHVILIAN